MVSSSDGSEHRLPSPVSNEPTDSQQRGDSTPIPSSSTSRLACLSQRYSTFWVSVQAQNLLMSVWRNQTSSYYGSAWRLWCCWCYQHQIHPLLANIQDVVNFFAHQFEVGNEYCTIKVYQSAIYTTLPKVDDLNVGQHPLVCQTMKGIFQIKAPLSRYSFSWDVSKELTYVKALADNECLTLKQLSAKLTLLLALTSAKRGSDLGAHDLIFKNVHAKALNFIWQNSQNLSELVTTLRGCLSKNRLLMSGSKNSFPSYFYHELHFSQ